VKGMWAAIRRRGGPGLTPGGALAWLALVALLPAAQSRAEVVQQGGIRATFAGELVPHTLPRVGSAPVTVSVGAKITPTAGSTLPQLRRIRIAINSNGHFEPKGLPVCRLRAIQPATTADALAACRGSLVGEGRFSANVLFSDQAPYPSAGKVYAFNSTLDGHPAILAHVFGTKPVPTSFTLPFELVATKGTFGTVLEASLPDVTGSAAYITGLQLRLGRSFSVNGHERSYLSAGCPAPQGFPGASFAFAKASLAFAGGSSIRSTLTRNCKASG
jgi:hypothetical protein